MGVATPAMTRNTPMSAAEVKLAVKPAPNAASVDMTICLRRAYEVTFCASTVGILCVVRKWFSFLVPNHPPFSLSLRQPQQFLLGPDLARPHRQDERRGPKQVNNPNSCSHSQRYHN